MAARVSRERPQTGYGSRRESATGSFSSSISPEKYPKRVEDLIEKKIASEYHFNKHSRLRRIQSDLASTNKPPGNLQQNLQSVKNDSTRQSRSRHRGDDNITDYDFTASLPVRMSNLDVKWPPSRSMSGQSSPVNHNHNNNNVNEDSSDDERPVNDVSPSLIRRHTSLGGNQLVVSNKIDANNAKLAMMKKKLSPLPNRQRFKSLPCSDELPSSKPVLSPAY